MRKALLVVTLVFASFAGGAFVNGPGLTWLKQAAGMVPRPVRDLGGEPPPVLDDEAPVVSVGPEPEPESDLTGPTGSEGPTPGDILTGLARPEDEDENEDDDSEPEPLALETPDSFPTPSPDSPSETLSEPVSETEASDPGSPTPPPLGPPSQARTKTEPEPTTLDPLPPGVPTRRTTPPSNAPALAGPTGSSASTPSEESPTEPGWGDAPGSAPATAILPGKDSKAPRDPLISGASMSSRTSNEPSAPPSRPDPPALQGPASGVPRLSTSPPSSEPTWSALKAAMSARGVSRYWAEGDPSGSVTFRCVVPLAGNGAVARQFEAQGADLPKAAEAALKRIDLWKATERK